ncbi:MAG: lipopolysaccharide heptosyltransferase II [Candidatus Omnitrophica bacterium]|nr:lipopolysaccharide heptosyltransferase II [Candidatus Omnitrophota bacterium]MDD5237030.1 lipopolysaccharide heptosyltransferase II [Candidatus Omnitrophota bacterium]MDD5610930.1 lipopolysaccharide heptosyltransferase II [Candidatus Omnitrophota bacterium]
MRILQILPELDVGGVETGTVDMAKYLIRLGHQAVVVSAGGVLVKELESLGAKHYTLPVNKKSFFNIRALIPQVERIIKNENIDVVHARSRVPAWIGFFATRRANRPFITTCHGYYSRHFFSRAMGWGKLIICPSEVIAHHMVENFGVPHERIRLIPRGVDIERFQFIPPDKKISTVFNVGIIGRLTPIKGHTYFLKAMAKVVRSFNRPKIKIWIVGDASNSNREYKEELRVMVRRLGIEHCTEFLGTQRDIPTVLSHLNLLVCPSITHEAFGRVLVEAGASGVPVVATYVGGIRDIVEHEKNGLLVAPCDPESLAQAIIRLVKDVNLATQLAQNAYKKTKEEFNVNLMVSRTLDVYKEAASNFKILVIKLSSLGDAILSTAAIRELRKKFPAPNYKIKVLAGKDSKDVFRNCPYIDGYTTYDYKDRDGGIKGLFKVAKELRRENFNGVIDFQNNRRSHLLSWLSMIPNRFGYDNRKLSFLLNYRVKDSGQPMDPVTHQFKVLNMLGVTIEDPYLEMWPSRQDEKAIADFLEKQWLKKDETLIGINLGASLRWRTKVWPQEHLIELCVTLAKKGFRVLFTGTEADLEKAETLAQSMKEARPIIACGKTTVNELACLIRRCSIFISGDSAPLHVAVAVGTPFIALFGPTDPKRHIAPFKKGIILQKNLDCGPCYKPKCKTGECMQQIRPGEVIAKIEELLKA